MENMSDKYEIGKVAVIGGLEFDVTKADSICRGCHFRSKDDCPTGDDDSPAFCAGIIFILREQGSCDGCANGDVTRCVCCTRQEGLVDNFKPAPKLCHLDPGKTFPAPWHGEMELGQEYWIAGDDRVVIDTWDDYEGDRQWQDLGLIHLTEEAAQAHRDARQAIVGEG